MSVVHTPGVGDLLGGCRLERLAARGGMGIVYEATQLALGRRVAVKVISPQLAHDPEFRERFVREAQVAASVHHPNIVDVYDAGEQDGVLYLVLRFVDGTDLRTVLRAEDRLSPRRAVRVAGQVASALDAAHAAGLIHRDVTPSNILLSGGPGDEQAALTDFGLVKHVDTAGVTKTGTWFGTLAFVAPEALRDERVDGRADVYALGCVLHRMLTGQVPFPRESDAAMIAAHLNDPPPRPSRVAGLDPAFDAVIARALAKDPERRFASAGDLAAGARAALSGEAVGGPPAGARATIRSSWLEDRTPATRVAADVTRRIPEPRAGAEATRAAERPPRGGSRGAGRTLTAGLVVLAAVLGAAGGVLAERLADGDAPAPARPAVPRTPAEVSLIPYRTPGYTAQVPRGWALVEDDADLGDFNRSTWRAPEPTSARLVIAYRIGSGATPAGIAAGARGRLAAERTYSEVAGGPIEIGGRDAWRWVYGLGGELRANWYLNPCGTSVAVSGAGRPAEFLRWSPTFRAVAASVRPACT